MCSKKLPWEKLLNKICLIKFQEENSTMFEKEIEDITQWREYMNFMFE